MIEVNNLVKNYGKYQAVKDISFRVEQGEVLGLLGPNGAGKSTTMNIITGYISATRGEVKIGGYDILKNPREAKKRIGYLPEIPPVYVDMTVTEYLNFVADLKGVKKAEVKTMLDDIMEKIKITNVSGKLIKNLSKGYRQRVGLAQAMVGYPDVLILDEPTVGLDPKQIIEIRDLISELGKTHTIILSSHILSEISAVCNRVIIIHNGQIVASDTPDGLSAKLSQNRYRVRLKGDENAVLEAFDKNENVAFAELTQSDEEGTCDIFLEGANGVDIRETAFEVAVKHNFVLLLINSEKMTLEDVFLQVTENEPVEEKMPEATANKNKEEAPKEAEE
ncbi:MAG TPA: ABC transporter [Lachnospiraceae bacterium]|nr:ABC transporter [Lachnospiraceae bacterium]